MVVRVPLGQQDLQDRLVLQAHQDFKAYQGRREIPGHLDSMFLVLQVIEAAQDFLDHLVSQGHQGLQDHLEEVGFQAYQVPKVRWA